MTQIGNKNYITKAGGIGNKLVLGGQIGRKLVAMPKMRIDTDILHHGLNHHTPTNPLEKASKSS